MSKISVRVAEFLEAFLSRRPPPSQLVEQGILYDNPASRDASASSTGPAQFFGLALDLVPKRDNVPVIVFDTCDWLLRTNGM
jgi:hypothetical protein